MGLMRLVLVGPPGSGKGTQSEWMKKDLGIPQLSTGDMLRDAVARGTELGKRVKDYLESGRLVPDEVILDLMRERLEEPDAQKGFILDGFPRTVGQAEGLEQMLEAKGLSLDRVIEIRVGDDEIVRRLTSRRVCPKCKAVYNLHYKPPKKEGVCDVCGTELIQRDDDKEETIRQRLEVYRKQTAPLIDFYEKRGLLLVVDGNKGSDSARLQIRKALGLPAEKAGSE